MSRSDEKTLRGAICQHVFVNGVGNLLVIPVEISDRQRALIDKQFGLDIDEDYDGYQDFYDGCYSEMLDEKINHLAELSKAYFLKNPDRWVRVARPIRITDKTVEKYLTKYRKDGKDCGQETR